MENSISIVTSLNYIPAIIHPIVKHAGVCPYLAHIKEME